MTIKIGENVEYTLIVIGDINRDGKISVVDVAKVKLHLIEKNTLTGIEDIAGDVNGDGKITSTDLAQINIS